MEITSIQIFVRPPVFDAMISIDELFVVEVTQEGQLKIPHSMNSRWEESEAQEYAHDNFTAEEVIEMTGNDPKQIKRLEVLLELGGEIC